VVDGEKPGELIPERRGSILEGKKRKLLAVTLLA